jgi:hypothetical protein
METVYGMASHIHNFQPKLFRRLVFSQHRPCHINERPIIPLHYTILLWRVASGELMLDALLLKVLFYLKIFELRSIVAPNLLHF